MLLIHSHSKCPKSKECVLKYDKNSYVNIGTIWKYLWNKVSRNILQYYAIIGCDATSFFYIYGNINPLKEVLKKPSYLDLIECLGENKSL